VALVLFTLVVTLGTFVANRVGGTFVGRFELNELHRAISIVAMVFLAIHIMTTVIDSYVATGLVSAVVPFTSSYKTLSISIGTAAFDLFLAVWISSLLKVRIPNRTWRSIHWFSWLGYGSAIVHGYLTGTDARSGWGFDIVLACSACGAAAGLWRYLRRPTRAAGRTALSPLAIAHPDKKAAGQPYVARSAAASSPRANASRPASRDGFSRGAAPTQKGRRR
jgi:predicted ferric reductase